MKTPEISSDLLIAPLLANPGVEMSLEAIADGYEGTAPAAAVRQRVAVYTASPFGEWCSVHRVRRGVYVFDPDRPPHSPRSRKKGWTPLYEDADEGSWLVQAPDGRVYRAVLV